jgi:biopolymer transport protein ExbD
MQFARKKRKPPFINIISLIDILVVLLIFYIVTTVFKKPQPVAKIQLPDSRHTTTAQGPPPDTLYLTADKKLFLEDVPIDIDKLADILKAKKAANPDYQVALKADEGVPFGMFIKVTDAMTSSGMKDLTTYMNNPAPAGGTNP